MDDQQACEHVAHDFRVMGTSARMLLRLPAAAARPLLDAAERELEELSARLTRFDTRSELEQLNEARDADVSPLLLEILTASRSLHSATNGRFTVGIGRQMLAAGYDRTFDELDQVDDDDRTSLHQHMLDHGSSDSADRAPQDGAPVLPEPFQIDGTRVRIHDGVRIDLGGIAKGWAADRVAQQLTNESGASSLVSLGGDVALQVIPGDPPWPVSASTGTDGRMTLALGFGGLATSGWDSRMWRTGNSGALAHHVIDPSTGQPAVTDIARITVIAESCMDAEAWAKALLLVGFTAASHEAERLQLTTIIVRADGLCRKTGALAA